MIVSKTTCHRPKILIFFRREFIKRFELLKKRARFNPISILLSFSFKTESSKNPVLLRIPI
jgi:hypothetical protein